MNGSTATRRVLSDCLSTKGHLYAVPNVFYWGGYESDVISVLKSGYVNEYEIKVDRSDFLRDFKDKPGKHRDLKTGRAKVNRFYFVCPKDLIKPDEVPDYAGLIWLNPSGWGQIQKKSAPMIHNEKLDKTGAVAKVLLHSLAIRYLHKLY